MQTHSIKAVVFDGDGTLYDVADSIGHQYSPIFIKHGVNATPDEINDVIHDAWKDFEIHYLDRESNYETTCEREEELWKKFVSRVATQFHNDDVPSEMLDEVYSHFSLARSRELLPQVREALLMLKDNNYYVALLTNNDLRIHDLIVELNLSSLIDRTLCACELGVKKPSVQCFERAERKLGFSPEELLYIGDNYEQDFIPAKAAGWEAFHFIPQQHNILIEIKKLLGIPENTET